MVGYGGKGADWSCSSPGSSVPVGYGGSAISSSGSSNSINALGVGIGILSLSQSFLGSNVTISVPLSGRPTGGKGFFFLNTFFHFDVSRGISLFIYSWFSYINVVLLSKSLFLSLDCCMTLLGFG